VYREFSLLLGTWMFKRDLIEDRKNIIFAFQNQIHLISSGLGCAVYVMNLVHILVPCNEHTLCLVLSIFTSGPRCLLACKESSALCCLQEDEREE